MAAPSPSGESLAVACVQVSAGTDPEANHAAVARGVRTAAAEGATLIALPEMWPLMGADAATLRAHARPQAAHPAVALAADLARETQTWLLAGTIAVQADDAPDRAANRSVLLAPDGRVAARYDKIHMFDVDLGPGERHRESALYQPGTTPVVAATPWGGLGMTVCYDIRFPALYQRLAEAGARLIAIPAAFTRVTGAAHWSVLVRARAIETGCFVIAPAQCGHHPNGRQTWGHSLIVDPWGTVLAEGDETPGVVHATLAWDTLTTARRRLPVRDHVRPLAAVHTPRGENP